MNTLALAAFAVLYTHSVYCSHYHGPTAKPVVLHNGYLADTHEVAAAKNAHLAALGQQHGYSEDHSGSHGDIRYHGPTAIPHVLHDGHIADTHEVAAAKNAHLAALGQQHGYSEDHSGSHGDIRYHGPAAISHVLHDGHIADTHEVAAAKNAHLAALGQQHGYSEDHSGSHGDIRYHGPTAIPHVLHDRHISDTHEVAAAKNAHLAALGQQHGYSEDHSGSHGDIRYHGPTAIPHVLHDGHIADTHEVAAAKNAHLAALGQQHSYSEDHSGSHGDIRYHGPAAIPHVLHDGHIADTHEVAAAKNAHLAALGQQHGYSEDHSGSHGDIRYHGPTAIPHVLHDRHISDTHEVAAAKNAHLAALGQQHGYSEDHSGSHGDIRYHGPTAIPHVLHDGHIADTHEVAAAKNAHLAALGQQHGYSEDHSGSHGDIRYHGPTAIAHVLHDGHIADTHEVAAAKNAHLAALGQQHGYSEDHSGSHGDIRYHGPTAIPHVLHDGHIADTHEVAAAKNAHLAALGQQHGYSEDHSGSHGDIRYHGPTAIPHVLHDGHIADTHEVAAAKNAHLAALGQQHGYSEDHSGSHGDIRYHGPTAIPHVLHDGHISDIHEVAASKAEHFAAVVNAKAHGDHYSGHHEHPHHVAPYHGPLFTPVVLKSGYLAATHEVAAAKEHHLHLLHTITSYGDH